MKEKIEETCDNKSDSTKPTKLSAVSNKYCSNGSNEKDRIAAAPLLDTVTEMFQQLQITPESEPNGISISNRKDNYLFINKLKQPNYENLAVKSNSGQEKFVTSNGNVNEAENGDEINQQIKINTQNSGAVVNSHNGFPDNQKAKDSLNSVTSTACALAPINGISLLGSTHKILKASVLSRILEDRKAISSTGKITSSDIFYFTAPPHSKPDFSKSVSTASSASKTISLSSTVQQYLSDTSKPASTFVDGGHNIQTSLTSLTPVSKILYQSPIKTSLKSDISAAAPSLTPQTSIQDVSQNKTQSVIRSSIPTALSAAAITPVHFTSAVTCNQNIEAPILYTPMSSEVKTSKPTFNTGQPNVTDFDGKTRSTMGSNTTKITPPLCETMRSVFNKTALMTMFDGSRNLFGSGTSTVQTSIFNDTKFAVSSFPFRNKMAASSELLSKKSLCSQKKLYKNSRIANTEFKMIVPTFTQQNYTTLYVFGSQETLKSIFDKTSITQNIFNKQDNSTLHFTIGASPSVFLDKSPAQQQVTRPTNELQYSKIKLYKYEDYKGALAMFEDALRLCPDNYTFYTVRAHYYMKLGMYREAIKDLQKIIKNDSSFIDGYIFLAKCYIALGDISAADDAVSKADQAGGATERANTVLCEVRTAHADTQRAVAACDYARAIACADRFLQRCPSNYIKAVKAKCLAMLGKIEQSLEIAEECLQNHNAEPEALYAKGLCLYFSCNLQQAVDYFQKVTSISPLHLEAIESMQKANKLKRLAKERKAACNEGDYEKVIILNNEALTTDKLNKEYNVKLYCNNAVMYTKLNKTQLALEACTAALKLNENCMIALRNRAKCYTQLGQYENAVRDCEIVYKIDKSVVNEELLNEAKLLAQEKEIAYREMVSSVEKLVLEKKFQQAQNLADECLKIRSSDTDVLYSKGLCFYYMGQYEKAGQHFKKVININHHKHHTVFPQLKKTRLIKVTIKQGDDLCSSGRWEEARCKYRHAKKIDYLNSNLSLRMHCKMAETYLKTNKIYDAIQEYTCALIFDNDSLEVLRARAKCYTENEEYENAIEDYLKIHDIDDCEETKQWALNFVETLKGKDACRKKIAKAQFLIKDRQTENLEVALNLAEECLQFDSSDIKALCVKGFCLYYKEQYVQALDQFQQILLLEPSHSTALQETKKISCLVRAIEKGNDSFKSRHWVDALDAFNEALIIDKHNKDLNVRLLCKMATIYSELNDIQSAIARYSMALIWDNNCGEAFRGRAQCYSQVNQYEDAIKDYEKLYTIEKCEVTKLSARNSIEQLKEKIAYRDKIERAEALIVGRETNNLKLALKLAEECLRINSSDTRALCVKGCCLYYKDQYEQALDQFQQVLLIEPSHSMALKENKKITCLMRTLEKGNDSFSRGRWQEALNNFNEALKIDDDNKNLKVRLYCKKAATMKLMSEHNIHAAVRDYTMALVLDSNCVEALRGRALCYTEMKQYEDAIKDYEKLYITDQSEETKQLLNKAKTAYEGQKYRFAQEKADIGNKLYKRKKFRDALAMYKEAIKLDPDIAEYYSYTYSCYLNLSMLKEALVDAKKAVVLDAKCSKGFGGIAKCYLALGELSGAERAIAKAVDAGYDCTDDRRALESLQRLHAQAQRYIDEQNYERAIACMDQCLLSSPFSSRAKLIKAECLAILGKIEQSQEIADDCIRINQSDADALFVKGLCTYYNEKHEQALKYFKEVLRMSPDHGKATAAYKKTKLLQQKKEQGNEEFKMGRWQKALLLYNEALAVDTTHVKLNAKLHFNKATVYWKLNQTQLAADSCTAAIELDENYVKALTLRADCYTALEEYDCVIDDYERLYKIDPSDNIKQLLDKAKRSHDEKSKRKNYYNILRVNRSATKSEIIRAYRQLSLAHHPDRHADRPAFERKRQERRFKDVSEAYTVLSDPVARRKYDASDRRVGEYD